MTMTMIDIHYPIELQNQPLKVSKSMQHILMIVPNPFVFTFDESFNSSYQLDTHMMFSVAFS